MDQGAGRGGSLRSSGFFERALDRLIAYAEHEARLNQIVEDGKKKTVRQHLQSIAAQDPSVLADLEGPRFPEELSHLWDWSQELHGQSGVGQSGWLPLTFTTIADWSKLLDINILPEEVSALMQIDRALLYPVNEGEDTDG